MSDGEWNCNEGRDEDKTRSSFDPRLVGVLNALIRKHLNTAIVQFSGLNN